MIRSFTILLAGICALGSASVSAAPTSGKDKKAILAAICERGQIRKGACRRARDYPEGRSCDIGLTGEGGEGRFLGSETTFLLVAYTSGCEPHANNWGGSLLFERAGRKLLFQGYQPGLAPSGCLTMARANGDGDRLVCMAGWMGQGYQTEVIGEVIFAKDVADKLTVSLKDLLSASRSDDARGANSVECGKPTMFFSFGKLEDGPSPESFAVLAVYAGEALIRTLCAKPDRNARLGTEPPPDNEAYIAKGQETKGRFVYDMVKRQATHMEDPTPAAR